MNEGIPLFAGFLVMLALEAVFPGLGFIIVPMLILGGIGFWCWVKEARSAREWRSRQRSRP